MLRWVNTPPQVEFQTWEMARTLLVNLLHQRLDPQRDHIDARGPGSGEEDALGHFARRQHLVFVRELLQLLVGLRLQMRSDGARLLVRETAVAPSSARM